MLEEIINERKKKVEELKKEDIETYPVKSQRTAIIGDVLGSFSKFSLFKKNFYLTGRIRSSRDQGKILFFDLEDVSGRIQIVAKKNETKNFEIAKKLFDTGDFIQVHGSPFKTKKGEKSIQAKELVLLSKSIRPLPSDFYGLEDTEIRLRKRYLDLILNKDLRELFAKKTKFWNSAREFMNSHGFMEVETPVMEATPGGAEAEPFVTHHNALDEDFYLRISLEIALKKLIVGGFEKVYEIGRIFRNEGIDAEHLQDYTQLELYWAYSDYNKLMNYIEEMYKFMIKSTFGTLLLNYKGQKIDWSRKWEVIDYCRMFEDKNNLSPVTATKEELQKRAKELKIDFPKHADRGRLIDLIYKKTIRSLLIQPCFLINPPVSIEPLAKRSPKNSETVERFQVMACGTELGKGFSELNDPFDQRKRFEEQAKLREEGDTEAQRLDEDFLEALEYGMPPTSGFGFSERLFSILVDKPMRETVFFPPMKKRE